MRLVSPVVTTGEMCHVEVQLAERAVVAKHLWRCLGSLPPVVMLRFIANQLRRVKKSGAKAFPKIYIDIPDGHDVWSGLRTISMRDAAMHKSVTKDNEGDRGRA